MRIIHGGTVKAWAAQRPDAAEARGVAHECHPCRVAEPGGSSGGLSARRPVAVASGRTVVVFNVRGNRYRLVTAIHYNRQIIYTLRFMTHAEYSKNRWKDTL